MKLLLPFALLATASAPAEADRPRTYLVSIVDIPLEAGESLESFSIATWGVEYKAVCKIPGGWRMKAGTSATPDGTLEGEGSQGATWFHERTPPELHEIVLIALYADVQEDDVENGPDATFKGQAVISSDKDERIAPLSYRNILLTPASRCP